MQRPIYSVVLTLAAVAAPCAAAAQGSVAFHASRGSTPDAIWLYGGTIGAAAHGFGLRIGGSAGQVQSPGVRPEENFHWTADADIVLAPTAWGGASAGGAVVPYIFAGAGMQPSAPGQSVNALPHWSWGGGVAIPIFSGVSLLGEARTRTLVDPRATGVITPDRRSTELRAGLSFGFGGGSARSAPGRFPVRAPSRGPARQPRGVDLPVPSAPGAEVGSRVLPTARQYVGVRYRYGGASPETGFDCSGFVQYVFARHDVRLPRTSRQQAGSGIRVEPRVSALRAGDLMFFAESGAPISHVAIYAGDNRIIHSTSAGGEVRYDDLASRRGHWFATRLVAARRISSGGEGLTNLVRALQADAIDARAVRFDLPDGAPRPE